jgi:hypothetical protein
MRRPAIGASDRFFYRERKGMDDFDCGVGLVPDVLHDYV